MRDADRVAAPWYIWLAGIAAAAVIVYVAWPFDLRGVRRLWPAGEDRDDAQADGHLADDASIW
jgi:hypothetical protein